MKGENNKIRIFNNKSNKNIFFPKYTFTVGERGKIVTKIVCFDWATFHVT